MFDTPFGEGRHPEIEQRDYRSDIIQRGYEASAKNVNYLIQLATGGGKTNIMAAILFEFLFKEDDHLGDTSFHLLLDLRFDSTSIFESTLQRCDVDLCTTLNQLDHRGRSVLTKALDFKKSDTLLALIRKAGGKEGRSARTDVLFLGHTHTIKKQNFDYLKSYFKICCPGQFKFFVGDVEGYTKYKARVDAKPCILFAMNTMGSRQSKKTLEQLNPSHFRAILVDEAHHSPASMYMRIFQHFELGTLTKGIWRNKKSEIWMLGATATVCRADKVRYYGPGSLFPVVSPREYTLSYLTEHGYLSPVRSVHFGSDMEMTSAWNNSINHAMKCKNECLIMGKSGYTRMLTFASYVEEANRIKARFDVVARHLGFLTTSSGRNQGNGAQFITKVLVGGDNAEAICKQFEKGEIHNIVSVGRLLEGVNVKETDTIILLRRSKSERVILQAIGRGTRKAKNKDCLQVIDAYNNVGRIRIGAVQTEEIEPTECAGLPGLVLGDDIIASSTSGEISGDDDDDDDGDSVCGMQTEEERDLDLMSVASTSSDDDDDDGDSVGGTQNVEEKDQDLTSVASDSDDDSSYDMLEIDHTLASENSGDTFTDVDNDEAERNTDIQYTGLSEPVVSHPIDSSVCEETETWQCSETTGTWNMQR